MSHLSFFKHTGETAQGPSFSLEACPQDLTVVSLGAESQAMCPS